MNGLLPDRRPALRQALGVLLGALLLPWLLPGPPIARSASVPVQNTWVIGSRVDLVRGTQIRNAQGFGSCYHTYVPEDHWQVIVTNGPRLADGRTWWDTSRAAAGDPSGGTGWVNQEQVDQFSGARDPGEACPNSQAWAIDHPTTGTPPTITPPIIIDDGGNIIDRIVTWWRNQPLLIRIAVVIIAFILIPASDRLRVWRNMALLGFVRGLLWGIVLGGVADLTRTFWSPYWTRLPHEWQQVDPALLLLFAPLGVWAFGYLAEAFTIALAIGLLLLTIVFFLLYIYVLASFLQ